MDASGQGERGHDDAAVSQVINSLAIAATASVAQPLMAHAHSLAQLAANADVSGYRDAPEFSGCQGTTTLPSLPAIFRKARRRRPS